LFVVFISTLYIDVLFIFHNISPGMEVRVRDKDRSGNKSKGGGGNKNRNKNKKKYIPE